MEEKYRVGPRIEEKPDPAISAKDELTKSQYVKNRIQAEPLEEQYQEYQKQMREDSTMIDAVIDEERIKIEPWSGTCR